MSLYQAEALDLEKTVIQTVEEAAEDWRIDDIKGLLGRCNFKADMLDRNVSLLSGGEKVYGISLGHVLLLSLKKKYSYFQLLPLLVTESCRFSCIGNIPLSSTI